MYFKYNIDHGIHVFSLIIFQKNRLYRLLCIVLGLLVRAGSNRNVWLSNLVSWTTDVMSFFCCAKSVAEKSWKIFFTIILVAGCILANFL